MLPLRTLLEIRRRSEEEAERALGPAAAAVTAAEVEQRRLLECVAAARARAEGARAYDGAQTAAAALATETFQARLRDEARQAEAAALTHRKGLLAAARAQEQAARERHASARRDRQAADQAWEREEAEQRRLAERRAEDARSDLAAAHRRGK